MVSIPVRSKASRTASKLARRKPPARPKTHPVYALAPARRTGAVRKSSVPRRKSSNRICRGIALSIAVTAAFGWIVGATTTESEKTQSHTSIPSSQIARASVSPPVFFFDDNEDALAQLATSEQSHSPFASINESEIETSPMDRPTANLLTDETEEQGADTATIDLNRTVVDAVRMDVIDAEDRVLEADEPAPSSVIADTHDVAQSSPVPLVFDPENQTGSAIKVSMGKSNEAATYTKPMSLPSPGLSRLVTATNGQLSRRGEKQNSAAPSMVTSALTVMPGDTLSGILNEQGVGIEKMPKLLNNKVIKDHLSNLEVGQKFELTQKNGEFYDLRARVGREKLITIKQSSAGLDISVEELPTKKVEVITTGTIEQSLYLAAEKAQLKQSTIMKLADIFQWELDFAKDIRKGDKFSLIFNKLYRGGEYVRDGEILAAQFVRGGKTHTAIRFTSEEGNSAYYSPDGKSKQRTFLRHPVDNVRITSRFNPNRMHPLLQKVRAHRGVDYGAPYLLQPMVKWISQGFRIPSETWSF
jgi:murein DD-endopeptidase MepM/ murein hydrolase activator NlpD